MRFRGWDIDEFGHLTDHHGGGLGDHLNVIVAGNETGKTTLHHFLRWVLLGFPGKTTNVLRRYRPDRIDVGGRLHVEHDGRELVVERHVSSNEVAIRTAAGAPAGLVQHDLTGAVTLSMYEAVFAIGLDELHGLRRMDPDAVRAEIYAAGMVGHGRSATAALDDLEARRTHLLSARKGFIHDHDKELARARAELRSAQEASQHLGTRQSEVDDAIAAELKIDTEIAELGVRASHLGRLCDLWPDWSAAAAALDEMQRLPDVDLGPDPIGRLDGELDRLDETDSVLTEIRTAISAARASLEAPDDTRHLTELATDLARASADLEQESARRLGLAEQRNAVEVRRRSAAAGLVRDLGPGWTVDRIRALDLGVTAVATVERAAALLISAETERAAAERSLELARRSLDSLADPGDVEGSERDHPARPMDVTELTELAGLVAVLDQVSPAPGPHLGEHRRARVDPVAVAGAVSAVAAVVALFAGQVLVAVALAVAGVITAWTLRSRTSAADPSSASPDLAAMRERSVELARSQGLDLPPTRAAVEERLRARGDNEDRRSRWNGERERLAAVVADRQLVLDTADTAVTASTESWRHTIAELRLPADLDAVAGPAFVKRAVDGLAEAALSDGESCDLDRVEAALGGLVDSQTAVLARAGIAVSDRSTVDERRRALDLLTRRVETARDELAESRRLESEIDRLEREEVTAAHRHATAAARVDRRLRAAGVDGPDEYRRLAADAARRDDLAEVVQRAHDGARVAFADGAEAAKKELDRGQVSDWTDEITRCEGEIRRLEGDRPAARERSAEARRRLRELEGSADVVSTAMRVDELRSDLAAAATEWLELTLARRSIERTLSVFERERQPDVVRWATDAFARVTDRRWTNLVVAENEIVVIDDRGRRLSDDRLSRGAIEQLYLCMRFGLAVDRARNGHALPLLLDDVLVNADPDRLELLAAELARVADQLQVVMFTASMATAELLRRTRPDTTIIELS